MPGIAERNRPDLDKRREQRRDYEARLADRIVPMCLGLDEAAHYIGVSAPTIRHLLETGQLHEIRIPDARPGRFVKRRLIDRVELESLVQSWKSKRPERTE